MYICCMSKSKQYSIAEARSSLSTIVDQAEAGQEVELTRRGKPVAVVISLLKLVKLRDERSSFTAAYKGFLTRFSLKDVGLDSGFVESIREKAAGREISL